MHASRRVQLHSEGSGTCGKRPFAHVGHQPNSPYSNRKVTPSNRCLRFGLLATGCLIFAIIAATFAPAQETTSSSVTVYGVIPPKTPASTEGLSFIFPTVGLFIGVSDYGEAAKVTSTPAHTLGAAAMYEAFVDAATASEYEALGIPGEQYFKEDSQAICAIAFSPNGYLFATGSKDGIAMLWTMKKEYLGKVVLSREHKADACAIAFSPDSQQWVTGGTAGDAVVESIYGEHSGKPAITLKHPAAVCSAAFSPNGSKVLTTSLDGTVRIWEPGKTQVAVELPPEKDCSTEEGEKPECKDGTVAAFGPDGNTVVTASCETVRVWSLDNPGKSTLLGNEKAAVRKVSFSADGSTVLSVTDKGVTLWPVVAKAGERQGREIPNGRNARFNPDGTRLAVGDARGFVKLYEYPSMKEAGGLGTVGTGVASLQFSQNGQYLLVNSDTGIAWMQETSGANRPTSIPRPDEENGGGVGLKIAIDRGTIPPERSGVRTEVAALSPDARYVVAGYGDGSVGIHPGINLPEDRAFRVEDQSLLADLKFDKSPTSIMALWFLEQLHGSMQQLHLNYPKEGTEHSNDADLVTLGRGEPVTRARIFSALKTAIQKAEQTAHSSGEATILVVYVAAHGWIGPDGRKYLLPSDADASNPGTWIAYDDLLGPVETYLTSPSTGGGRVFNPKRGATVIFDTCQTRLESAQKTPVVTSAENLDNLTVIESTSPGEYAWQWTGNFTAYESTTSNKTTKQFGFTHSERPKDTQTKSDYLTRMSMFPYASQWALNVLIKDKGTKTVDHDRVITLGEWMSYTQLGLQRLQGQMPDVKESGHVQEVQYPFGRYASFSLFEVEPNASPK